MTGTYLQSKLTQDISGRHVKLGEFEMDFIWVYVLGVLIIVGVVVGIVLCCCLGDDSKPKPESMEQMMEKMGEEEKKQMEELMQMAQEMGMDMQ
mmetsp:Transcript_2162/g.3792  ORF Transcript_2162/g.3792 Transcript_2162/m.3792 type:complete len:94 (+) Transcript_2162:160-441(+)